MDQNLGDVLIGAVKQALATKEDVTITIPVRGGDLVNKLAGIDEDEAISDITSKHLTAARRHIVAAMKDEVEPIKVLIEMSDGAIVDVTTNVDDPMEVLLVDRDIQTADPEDDRYVGSVMNEPAMVQVFEAEVDPAKINQVWAEAWATAANADIPDLLPAEEAQGCGCFNESEETSEPEIEEDIDVELR